MKKLKILSAFLILILFLSSHSFPNINKTVNGEDEFLEWILKQDKTMENEDLLFLVGKTYENLGMHGKSKDLFFELKSERKKFLLLKHFIQSTSPKNMKDTAFIEKKIRSLEDHSSMIELYRYLICEYFKIGENSKVKTAYKECFNSILRLKNDDVYEEKIFYLIDLSYTLYKIGLETEGDKTLNEAHNLSKGLKDISLKIQVLEYTLYNYIKLNNQKKADEYALKIIELLDASNDELPLHNLNLVETFIGLGRLDNACDLSKKIIKEKGLHFFLKEQDSLLVNASALLLPCNIVNEAAFGKALESMGTSGVIFLIETGQLKKAYEMAKKMDAKANTSEFRDSFYFNLGKKLLKESRNRVLKFQALNLAYKIKDIHPRIELMTEIALDFQRKTETDTFLKIMNDVTRMTGGKNVSLGYGKKDLAFIWLEAGFPEKSMQLIERNEDKLSQALDLYKFGKYALTHNNEPLAEKVLLKFKYNSVFKGLLLSKIAAWNTIHGNHKLGVKLFKTSFEVMQKNEDEVQANIPGFSFMDYISTLFEDYTNARVHGRIIETDLEQI